LIIKVLQKITILFVKNRLFWQKNAKKYNFVKKAW
jgi:hypothetical protein